MRRLFLVAVMALAAAPAAQAKGPFEVCGATACVELAPETAAFPVRLSLEPNTPQRLRVAPAPYFNVRWGHGPLAVWVPSAQAIRINGLWVAPTPAELALLQDKTAGLAPFAPPRHAVAWVNWQTVRNGDGYLKLVTIGKPVASAPSGTQWVDVRVLGGASPWNDGSINLSISRSGYLLRDGSVFQIDRSIAGRVLARRAI
jgi:hypothetical protein